MPALPKQQEEEAARGRGRPRCEDARKRILDAALELVEQWGFAQTTTDAIADRAGASKATIYRWWNTKSDLLVEALRVAVGQEIPFPQTGDLREDIRIQLRNFVKMLNGRRGRSLRALIAAAQNDEEAATAFLTMWIKPRRLEAKAVLQSHQANGQLNKLLDLDLVLDLLYGPLYLRLISGYGKLTAAYADELTELAFHGFLRS